MPLPDGDIAWPPASISDLAPTLHEWACWYEGDQTALTGFYQQGRGQARTRPSQLSGGLVGRVARYFWGQPPADNPRPKLHVPLATDITTASADLLFGESLDLTPPDELDGQQAVSVMDRLADIQERIGWEAKLLEAADAAAGLGGVYFRIVWDADLAPHPMIDTVHADAAWPVFRLGMLAGVTFWTVLDSQDSGERLRLLEEYAPGRINYGLFRGTVDRLGRRVPLTEHPATADLTVDADSGVDTGYPGLAAVYIPNVRPARGWRSHGVGSNLGQADYATVLPLLDALDETYTSWMRDVRLAKGRVIVPAFMLEAGTPGQPGGGAVFDLDREVYQALTIPPNAEQGLGQQLTVQQFAIRTAEHAATARDLVLQVLRGSGYSAQTFGYAEKSAATATEVNAREKRSMSTRERKTRYWGQAISHLLEALLAVDAARFGGPGVIRPRVEFPPAGQTPLAETASTLAMLKAAQAASISTRVTMVHPDWTDDQVAAEVAAIMDEESLMVPDPGPIRDESPDLLDPAEGPPPEDPDLG